MTVQVTARRFALARPGTAAVLGSLVLVEVAAVVVLTGLSHQLKISNAGHAADLVIFVGVGVLVARRATRWDGS